MSTVRMPSNIMPQNSSLSPRSAQAEFSRSIWIIDIRSHRIIKFIPWSLYIQYLLASVGVPYGRSMNASRRWGSNVIYQEADAYWVILGIIVLQSLRSRIESTSTGWVLDAFRTMPHSFMMLRRTLAFAVGGLLLPVVYTKNVERASTRKPPLILLWYRLKMTLYSCSSSSEV